MKTVLLALCFFLFCFSSCHSKMSDNDALATDSLVKKPVNKRESVDSFIRKKIAVDTEADSIQPHTTLDSLQGIWISDEDKGDHVVIHGHRYDESNIGDTLKNELYLADTCVSNRNELDSKRQSGSYVVTYDVSDTTESYCYAIDEIDNEHLALIYMGRGNTLGFHRMKMGK